MVRFYVGEITEPQTVKIYTDLNTSVDVTVSKGNKWYSYVLPKDKGLCTIEGDSVKKVAIKSNISYKSNYNPPFSYGKFIPTSTIEASFKGSNTSNVTDMNYMFWECSGLTSLDVSNFDTSKVTNMKSMFYCCSGLTSLDLSGWDMSNVTNMRSMFYNCSGLTSLDLSGWDMSNVTDMAQMFYNCRSLTSLDLSGWNVNNVNNVIQMDYMFGDCIALKTIRMVGCSQDTIQKITDIKPSGATIVTE